MLRQWQTVLFYMSVFKPDRFSILDTPKTLPFRFDSPLDPIFRRSRQVDLQVPRHKEEFAVQPESNRFLSSPGHGISRGYERNYTPATSGNKHSRGVIYPFGGKGSLP